MYLFLKWFRKLSNLCLYFWFLKYIIRGPVHPMASYFSALWWNWPESKPRTHWEHLGMPLLPHPPTNVFWLMFALSFQERQRKTVTEWQCSSSAFGWHCTVCPKQGVPPPLVQMYLGSHLHCPFQRHHSSLLAVTSRVCSFWYVLLWHFSLVMCPFVVIILADFAMSLKS